MTPYASRLTAIERAHRNEELWQRVVVNGETIYSVARDVGLSTFGVYKPLMRMAEKRYGRKFHSVEEVRNESR